MFSVISAVVGYYFGSKAADAANQLAASAQQTIIDAKDAELQREHQRSLRQSPQPHGHDDEVIQIGP
jgi:hypothetical protein